MGRSLLPLLYRSSRRWQHDCYLFSLSLFLSLETVFLLVPPLDTPHSFVPSSILFSSTPSLVGRFLRAIIPGRKKNTTPATANRNSLDEGRRRSVHRGTLVLVLVPPDTLFILFYFDMLTLSPPCCDLYYPL
jgi:hypothetical protein